MNEKKRIWTDIFFLLLFLSFLIGIIATVDFLYVQVIASVMLIIYSMALAFELEEVLG